MKNEENNYEKVLYEAESPDNLAQRRSLQVDPESYRYINALVARLNRRRGKNQEKRTQRDAVRAIIQDRERFLGRRKVPGYRLALISKMIPSSGEQGIEKAQEYDNLLLSEETRRYLTVLVMLMQNRDTGNGVRQSLKIWLRALTGRKDAFKNVAPLEVVFIKQDP